MGSYNLSALGLDQRPVVHDDFNAQKGCLSCFNLVHIVVKLYRELYQAFS